MSARNREKEKEKNGRSSKAQLLCFASNRAKNDPIGTLDMLAEEYLVGESVEVRRALETVKRALETALPTEGGITPLLSPIRPEIPGEQLSSDGDVEDQPPPPCFPFGNGLFGNVFVLCDDPNSSKAGKMISIFVMVLIMISTTSFLLESMQEFRATPAACQVFIDKGYLAQAFSEGLADAELCEPQPFEIFHSLEVLCISLFTVEYLARILTVWAASDKQAGLGERKDQAGEPISYSGHGRTFRYCTQGMNLIDFMAIFPFYVQLVMGGASGGTAVLRVLRLARVFRIFKMGKFNQGLTLFVDAMLLSTPAVGLLAFFGSVIVILFGSLMYFCESATFDVSVEYANYGLLNPADPMNSAHGAIHNQSDGLGWGRGEGPGCNLDDPMPYDASSDTGCRVGIFVRPVTANDFATDFGLEPSPFISIPVALWWCMTTITTVGYGDFFPTTVAGRVVGILCFYAGIIFLAMPITILGLSFEQVYTDAYGEHEADKVDGEDTDDILTLVYSEEEHKKRTRYSLQSKSSKSLAHELTASQAAMTQYMTSSSISECFEDEEDEEDEEEDNQVVRLEDIDAEHSRVYDAARQASFREKTAAVWSNPLTKSLSQELDTSPDQSRTVPTSSLEAMTRIEKNKAKKAKHHDTMDRLQGWASESGADELLSSHRTSSKYAQRYKEAEKDAEWQRSKTWVPGISCCGNISATKAWRAKWSNHKAPSVAQVVYHILDIPESSKLSQCVSWIVLMLIVISTITFLMATEPQYMQTPAACFELIKQRKPLESTVCAPEAIPVLQMIEAVCITIFTVEYVGRVLTVHSVDQTKYNEAAHIQSAHGVVHIVERAVSNATHISATTLHPCIRTLNYCLQPMNLVDVVAIAPFYIVLILGGGGGGLGVLRVLRLVRIFRILRMPKYQSGMVMFGKVLYRSAPALGVLVFLSLLCFVLFGAMMFFAEGGSQFSIEPDVLADHPRGAYVRTWDGLGEDGGIGEVHVTPFRSIPHCFWWVATTMTTVGYGDFYPTSAQGWFIGVLAFFGGIMTLALPTTIIGAEFADLYLEWVEEQQVDKDIQLQLFISMKERKEAEKEKQKKDGVTSQGVSPLSTGRKEDPGGVEMVQIGAKSPPQKGIYKVRAGNAVVMTNQRHIITNSGEKEVAAQAVI
jgi:hypothetical protein